MSIVSSGPLPCGLSCGLAPPSGAVWPLCRATGQAGTGSTDGDPARGASLAVAVNPGDTYGLLMEIGALGSPDIGIMRRTREALVPADGRASDVKDWEQAHTIGVLREALAQSDSAAYLAYRVRDNHRAAHTAEYAEALRPVLRSTASGAVWPGTGSTASLAVAVVGAAVESLSSHRRPWEIEPNDLSMPEWRKRVWKLLVGMPGNALPKPTTPHAADRTACTCTEPESPGAFADEHTDWCPSGTHSKGRSNEP